MEYAGKTDKLNPRWAARSQPDASPLHDATFFKPHEDGSSNFIYSRHISPNFAHESALKEFVAMMQHVRAELTKNPRNKIFLYLPSPQQDSSNFLQYELTKDTTPSSLTKDIGYNRIVTLMQECGTTNGKLHGIIDRKPHYFTDSPKGIARSLETAYSGLDSKVSMIYESIHSNTCAAHDADKKFVDLMKQGLKK